MALKTTWRNRGGIERGFKRKFQKDMKEAGQMAAEAMKARVSSSGRVDTRAMVSAPIISKFQITEQTYRIGWGWPIGVQRAHRDRMTRVGQESGNPGSAPSYSYFQLQDHGYLHSNGTVIEGMHAAEEGRRVFMQEMRRRGW